MPPSPQGPPTTKEAFEAEAFGMIPSLLADVYGRQWRSLVHADVLRAALDVAWVRTRRAHPRVEGVDSWNRFAPGIKRMARCKRFLGVGDGAPPLRAPRIPRRVAISVIFP